MGGDQTYQGYTLEQIFWWIKRLSVSENFSMRIEASEYRLIFSHKTCGTQELYGSMWTIAKNAVDALQSAINKADHVALEAFAAAFPESASA